MSPPQFGLLMLKVLKQPLLKDCETLIGMQVLDTGTHTP